MMMWLKATSILLLLKTSHGWVAPTVRTTQRTSSLDMSSSSGERSVPDLKGKVIYQRLIHRLSPQSDVDLHNNFSVEERVRFRPDNEDDGYLEPYGRRTLILRGPPAEKDDLMGPELYRLDVHEATETHGGIGNDDLPTESCICTILYLASNPDLLVGNVMDLQCQLGLGGLLGCIAAGFTQEDSPAEPAVQDDLMPQKPPSPFPKSMETLTLADNSEDMLNLAFANAKNSGVESSKVNILELEWTRRPRLTDKYHVILGSDIYITYPTSRGLARTVAYSLEPLPWEGNAARFIHVYRDVDGDDIGYLKKFLRQGYRMNLDVGYLQMEKHFLKPSVVDSSSPEDSALDKAAVEIQTTKETVFECLTAMHHPDYTGDNGEYFFPIENGTYESGSGSTYLERDSPRNRW